MSKKMQFGRGYSEIEKIIRLKAYQGKRKYDYIPLQEVEMNRVAGCANNKKRKEIKSAKVTFSPTKKICLRDSWLSK